MTDGLTVNGSRELTTAQIRDYVHQASEIEKDIYTLEESENQFKEKAKNLRNSKEIIEEPELESVYEIKKFTIGDKIFLGITATLKLALCIGVAMCEGLFLLVVVQSLLGFLISVMIGTVGGVLWVYIPYRNLKKDNERFNRMRDEHIKENEKRMEQYRLMVKEEEETYAANCAKANIMEQEAKLLRQRRAELENLRSQFYSIGVIPPDYRTMDCVYGLDHIFRNQLADTVREAILQYEDRVFKGQVIKGMGAILSQLQSLGTQMAYIVNDIHAISRNVEFMSQDLSNLVDSQVKSQKTLDSILKESKATRYANEAIQKHNKEVQKYMDDTRRRFNY